jgi:hypothetical protein
LTRQVRNLLLLVVLALAAGVSAQTHDMADVMRRAHAYVVAYEDAQLSSVVATEQYYQRLLEHSGGQKAERTLLSEFLIFQLPPAEDWFALRDVHQVDGSPIERGDVFARLCARSPNAINERAMEIVADSARYNLGNVYRTINLPTYALRFLRPANRSRFRFRKEAELQAGGETTWIVSYEETGRPTFSETIDGYALPAEGRFWIEPASGVVVRSEMIVGGSRLVPDRATITVTYGQAPSVGFRVPVEMSERYDRPRQKRADVITSVATYSNFRRIDLRPSIPPEPASDGANPGAPPAAAGTTPIRPCAPAQPA